MDKNTVYSNILFELEKIGCFDETILDKIKRKIAGKEKMPPPSSSALIKAYHELLKTQQLPENPQIERLLKRRKIRTASGVAIITNLVKPYPCPGKCTYCPTEKNMPKSYLSTEPAAARALRNKFDPYRQTMVRLEALENNNHPTDKIELIIKGGTWNAYPRQYQNWFIKRCFEACNEFESRRHETEYEKTQKHTSLMESQTINETAKNRIIGLTLETRPDHINSKEIIQLRKLGCTRVELGAQIIDDRVLKIVRRGHTVLDLIIATKLLKDTGFKVDFHVMPMLQGSTPENDLEKYQELFANPDFRPDMVKIYPCAVVKNSLLEKLWKIGKYIPYEEKKLFELLLKMKKITPRYVRISRLIRDIPSTDIVAGSKITNLRELLQKSFREKNIRCQCLRCREIAHVIKNYPNDPIGEPTLFIESYEASGGKEYFLSFEDIARKAVFAFCRMRIPTQKKFIPQFFPELQNAALVRELHTYGHLISLGKANQLKKEEAQHLGFGKILLKKAEELAQEHGFLKIAVIAGVGVREYYKKLGYHLEGTYMIKKL